MQCFHVKRPFALIGSIALIAGGLASRGPLWAADFSAATKAGGGSGPTSGATIQAAPTQTTDGSPGANGSAPPAFKPTLLNKLERFLPNSQAKRHAAPPVAGSPIANRSGMTPPAPPSTPAPANVRPGGSAQQVSSTATPNGEAPPNAHSPAAAASPPQASGAAAAEPPQLDEEEQKKVEMIHYLATLGCEACYPETESALLVYLGEENEQVRFEAARALGELAGRPCCWCNAPTCVSEAGLKRLEDVGYGRRENGRFKERSLRVRKLARLAARSASEQQPAPRSVEGVPAVPEQTTSEQLVNNGTSSSDGNQRAGAAPESGAADSGAAEQDATARDAEMMADESTGGDDKLAATDPAQSLGPTTDKLKFDKMPAQPAKRAADEVVKDENPGASDPAATTPLAEVAPPSDVANTASDSDGAIDETRGGQVAAKSRASLEEVAAPSVPAPDLAAALAKSVRSMKARAVAAKPEPATKPEPLAATTVATPRVDPLSGGGASLGAEALVPLPPLQSPPSSVAGGKASSRRTPVPSDDAPTDPPSPTAEPEQQVAIPIAMAPSPAATVRIDSPPRNLESYDAPPAEPLPQPNRLRSNEPESAKPGLVSQPEIKPAVKEVLAEINGEKITSDQVLPAVEAALRQQGAGLDPASLEELRRDLLATELRRAIDRKLLCQVARSQTGKAGVVSTSFDGKSAGESPAEEAKLAELWLQRAVPVDATVTAAELEAFQRAHGQRPVESAMVRCEIYTAPRTHYRDLNQAKAVLEYAQARAAGERPPLPRDADPAAVQRQTYRLTNSPGAPVGPLADAIFSLPTGGQSKVVEDSRGWHVVRVAERRLLAPTAASGQQNERLRAAVLAERRRQQEQAYLAQLRRQARVWTAIDSEMR